MKKSSGLKRTELKRTTGLKRTAALKSTAGLKSRSTLKPGGRLRHRKPERAPDDALYEKVKKDFLARHPKCQRCPAEPLGGTVLHHRAGRTGKRLYDIRFFAALCVECHAWTENFPKAAKKAGWVVTRQISPDAAWKLLSDLGLRTAKPKEIT